MDNLENTKDRLEEILSDQEYQVYYEDNRSFIEKLWNNLRDWMMEQLSQAFSSLNPASGLGDFILVLLILVLLGLFLVVVMFFFRSANRKRRFYKQQPLNTYQEMDWTYKQHIREAETKEAKQDYTQATRHLFLALLLYLDELKWVEAKIWKTNWEYADELRKIHRDYATSFNQVAKFFDEVVYGEHAINEEEFYQFKGKILTWIEAQEKKHG